MYLFKNKKKFFLLFILIANITFLSSCYKNINNADHIYLSLNNFNLEGKWIDENGIISSFKHGVFESRSGDTDEKISEGVYFIDAKKNINIEIFSLVRGIVFQVNCFFNNNSNLNCSTKDGKYFKLKKI